MFKCSLCGHVFQEPRKIKHVYDDPVCPMCWSPFIVELEDDFDEEEDV